MYLSKHIDVIERNVQPYEMINFFCKSVVVLKLQICLTHSSAVIFNWL